MSVLLPGDCGQHRFDEFVQDTLLIRCEFYEVMPHRVV